MRSGVDGVASSKKTICDERGVTLIELMIAVAIIGILAKIAYPAYVDYVMRGKVVDATQVLASRRAAMEQYFQDNRTYVAVTSVTDPCSSDTTAGKGSFTISCTARSSTAYTITATGSGAASGFIYTIDQNGTQKTTSLPSGWGTTGSCWVLRKGDSCS